MDELTPADLAREHADLLYEVSRLKIAARRDTDRINDAEEAARVYRRLAIRQARRADRLEERLRVAQERLGEAPGASVPETGSEFEEDPTGGSGDTEPPRTGRGGPGRSSPRRS